MNKLVKPVRELDAETRKGLEAAFQTPLADDQQVAIEPVNAAPPLPDYYRVYEGLSDQQIEELEKVILNRDDWDRYDE